MERVRTRGMFLLEGDRKLFVRGVSYGPFRPNGLGEPFPDKRAAERDFGRMRELAANTLRVYDVPPPWFYELALAYGVRLMVGIPWTQHIRFLDSKATRRDIRTHVRRTAASLRALPNLLAVLIGNEISSQLVRWYGPDRVRNFLAELADEVRQADPEALVSYANFPMTEYLELDFLDFSAVNVYLNKDTDLRRYVRRLQNLAGLRPLVLSEIGADGLCGGEVVQAEVIERSLTTAAELGCAGAVVFSYTDEWHTRGHDINEWAFGLVTKAREPKPAFSAVQRVFRSELPPRPDPVPKVSVVVCAYNAERTLEECLESLRHLRYPRSEIIVVDDGSTDRTQEIAERFPEFQLLSLPGNCGLSAARNQGILAATGDIVAFTDSDCVVDPDWLTFLVPRLLSGEFAGVGGPNLPPPEDHWLAAVVSLSPGGPTHVLLTDEEAEHVPGCNMAFWRKCLLELGLFDPAFRTAGDDVDICWRLQNAGHKLGFAAAALVWHRPRHTMRAYLRQQRGYGRAEALLYFKHPDRFNTMGSSRWIGRVYADFGPRILSRRAHVYGGPFGSGPFQTLYEPPSSLLRYLPATLEWNAVALALFFLALISPAVGLPGALLWAAGLALPAVSIGQAVSAALRADVNGLPPWRSRVSIAVLHYLGPLMRALERKKHHVLGLSQVDPVRFRQARQLPELKLWRRSFIVSYWNETAIEKEACISAIIDFLRLRKYPIIIDDGWCPWDLSIFRRVWVRAETKILVQDHGAERREVDVEVALRQTGLAKGVKLVYGACALFAWTAGSWSIPGLLALATIVHEASLLHQAYRLGRTIHHAVEFSFASLALHPMGTDVEDETPV